MKVQNFDGVRNQFVIVLDNKTIFQSYDTIIVSIETDSDGQYVVYVDNNAENYSKTTSKYLYRFLCEYGVNVKNKKELLKAINEEKIIRKSLNN